MTECRSRFHSPQRHQLSRVSQVAHKTVRPRHVSWIMWIVKHISHKGKNFVSDFHLEYKFLTLFVVSVHSSVSNVRSEIPSWPHTEWWMSNTVLMARRSCGWGEVRPSTVTHLNRFHAATGAIQITHLVAKLFAKDLSHLAQKLYIRDKNCKK